MKGRTYRFAASEPLYPFGFGLGYAEFAYERIDADHRSLAPGQSLTFRVMVSNRSRRETVETVQCYLVPPRDWPEAPNATLVAFEKIAIAPDATAQVAFTLTESAFLQVDADGRRVRVPGSYEIVVGPASPGPRAQALGAPAPVRAQVELLQNEMIGA